MRDALKLIGREGAGFPARFLAALCLLAVCGTAASAQPDRSAVYRRPIGHDPQTLDPARLSDIYGRTVAHQLFDGLVQFDATLMAAPALAEYWKATRDGLSWTFTLRKGVRFHDGSELTAADVVYSLTRVLDPATRSGGADLFAHIQGAAEFRAGRAKSVAGLKAVFGIH